MLRVSPLVPSRLVGLVSVTIMAEISTNPTLITLAVLLSY